ncbi:MAG: tetratricopeptide repeat protein [Acidobacteriaceae bacterium]
MPNARNLYFLLLAICSLTAWPQAPMPSASSSSIADAQKLLDTGHLDEALKALDDLALKQPEPAGVERLRGTVFYQQGKLSSASAAFERALAQDPADREAMQMQGVVLFRSGKPGAAIPLLEKARVSIPRSNIDSNYVLGLCYLDTRRYDDARKAFAIQYNFPPDSPSAYLLAARMMLRRDYLPVADSFAHKALELNPNLPMAHLLVGQIRLSQSQLPEAVQEFARESELNPLYGEVYERLGDAYLRQGDYDKAQSALDRAVLLEPNSSAPYILLGKVLVKQQDPVMAKMYLDKALSIDPGNYTAHTLMGQVYRSLGQAGKASHEFQLAEQIQAEAEPKLETPK